jgi:hypothetical protein
MAHRSINTRYRSANSMASVRADARVDARYLNDGIIGDEHKKRWFDDDPRKRLS